MPAARRTFRDQFQAWVPPWLSDRNGLGPGKNVGFRLLWTMIGSLDNAAEHLVQGLQAAWPGLGTPTALAEIGRSRGIIRGRVDTDDSYAALLRTWLDLWPLAGSQLGLARVVRNYVGGATRVRVVNRAGLWTTIDTDGTVTRAVAAWDWDSVSNPARAGYWWDEWIIVYPTPYTLFSDVWGAGTWGDAALGFGHNVPATEYDELRLVVETWRSLHSRVRALIWTSDAALFNPASPGSLPNGTWGDWGNNGVPSGRNVTTCRYWEFD